MSYQPLPTVLIAAILAIFSTLATAECWRGDGETGELRFVGAVEGDRFYGRFRHFTVEVCRDADSDWADSEWTVTVDTASADTRNRDRDDILIGDLFFASEQFPTARWQSEQVEAGAGGLSATGLLSLKNQSLPQTVSLSVSRKDGLLQVAGSAVIYRLSYGVGQGEYEDPDFIRNRVDLIFELQLVPQA